MSIKWKVNADSKVNMSKIHRCLNLGFSRILGGEIPLYRKEITKPDRPNIQYFVEVSDHVMVWIEYKGLSSNIDYIADDIPYLEINKILGELVGAGIIED